MVDEYQDTNYIQYLLVRQLAKKYGNLCVVGDEDQSIYMWRGANIENILNFEKDFPNAKIVKLEQNYRSTKRIIESASAVIGHNQKRIAKTLWTDNPPGEMIKLVECDDERQEAERVVETMLRISSQGFKYKDFAVFYRVNAQSRTIEDSLRRREIPYQVFGGLKFYDRKEVKDILAYLRLLANPDDSVALGRVINTPTRGIGPGTVDHLNRLANAAGTTAFKSMPDAINSGQFPERARNALKEFLKIIAELDKARKDGMPLRELVEFTMEKSGYELMLLSEGTAESEARLENLAELVNAMEEYSASVPNPTLEEFLEKTALFNDIDRFSEQGMISLMTLHTAKGLEFPVVMIVGLEEGLMPHIRSLDEGGEDELEEERRLFYVGMTRAEQRLLMYYTRFRRLRGREMISSPSRFIEELPVENMQVEHGFGMARSEPGRVQLHKKSKSLKSESYEKDLEPDYSQQEVWDSEMEIAWKPGITVRHPTFGKGVVERIEGHDDKIKLVVKFGKGVTKKLLAKFAKLEVIE
jgi:DNA helicase-2/ATP-dependent DNA helicase PcrA